MVELEIGPFIVMFHKTLRSKDILSDLPPSLGLFEISKLDNDYTININNDAMWMSFQSILPVACIVGVNGVNAITGKPLCYKLEPENYFTVPPQLWLDYWKSGCLHQFVGNHVIEILIFEAKDSNKLDNMETRKLSSGCCYSDCSYSVCTKIDPYGIEEWKDNYLKIVKVHLV